MRRLAECAIVLAALCAAAPALAWISAEDVSDTLGAATSFVEINTGYAAHDDHAGMHDHVLTELLAGAQLRNGLGIEGRVTANVMNIVIDSASDKGVVIRTDRSAGDFDYGAGFYLRFTAGLSPALAWYVVAGEEFASFRRQQCDVVGSNTLCHDESVSASMPAWGGGLHWKFADDGWAGVEVRRMQGDGMRMNFYGVTVGTGL